MKERFSYDKPATTIEFVFLIKNFQGKVPLLWFMDTFIHVPIPRKMYDDVLETASGSRRGKEEAGWGERNNKAS